MTTPGWGASTEKRHFAAIPHELEYPKEFESVSYIIVAVRSFPASIVRLPNQLCGFQLVLYASIAW